MNRQASEIKRFLNGRMSSGEKSDFQTRMDHDLFLSEAVEGFQKDPGALSDLPMQAFGFQWWSWSLTGLVGVLITLFTIPGGDSPMISPAVVSERPAMELNTNRLPKTKEHTIVMPAESIERSAPEQKPADAGSEENVKPVTLNLLSSQKPVDLQVKTEIPVLKTDAQIVYILDYKTVGYSEGDKKRRSTNLSQLTRHTPANYDSPDTYNRERKLTTQLPDDKSPACRERLESGLRALSRKRYTPAIQYFSILLEDNPMDVNAAFYSGLCRYNTGDYQTALTHFTKVENNMDQSFAPEAKWYRALSLLKLGQKEQALEVLREIVSGSGHYSERADDLRDSVEAN